MEQNFRGKTSRSVNRLRYIDFSLYAPLFGLLALLWVALYSATQFGQAGEALRQAAYIAVGTAVMIGLTALDYRHLKRLALPLYLLTLLSLVVVLVGGQSVNGSQRWLQLGPLGTFQPSELAKLTAIITGSVVLAPRFSLKRSVAAGLALLPLFLLILIQPDLGTSLVLVAVGGVMAYVAGVNGTFLFASAGLGVAALPLVLKEYQRDRLMVFVNPEIDPMGMGYQLVQSQTAIGSGGVLGKGLMKGHMTQHGFVPENWTDFIFTVIGEELGLLGGCGLLLMFLMLFVLILHTGYRAVDRLGGLLCTGVATLLLFQVFVNIGMTIGLAPVVGLPLPFGSYGGSAILVSMSAIGIVGSVRIQARIPEDPLSDAAHPSMEGPAVGSVVEDLAS
jgi:rod shape determining protein RodA